jgi:hypothetical protein
VVYIGIPHSVDFIWDFLIVIGKPIHFGDSWWDPPMLLPSPYRNPLLDMFQNCNTLLTSLNVRISRGLEQVHRMDLAKSAQVTCAAKDDWSRAGHAPRYISNPAADRLEVIRHPYEGNTPIPVCACGRVTVLRKLSARASPSYERDTLIRQQVYAALAHVHITRVRRDARCVCA